MRYRMSTLLAEVEYTADTVKTIDIDLVDPISEIEIQANPLNDTSNVGPGVHPAAVLEKVEIVDGSDVLFSLDGYQMHALEIYNRDRQRSPWYCYLNDNYTSFQVGINFGRYLWDERLAFDPTKFTNPQLKLTIDEDGGGSLFDAVKVAVNAAVFDERVISPTGFLMAKGLKEYTMGSATHEYTDMPVDYVYRKMFVQAMTPGSEPGTEIDTLKLSENHDKKIPFNGVSFEDIHAMLCHMHPPIVEGLIQTCLTTTTAGYCTPSTRVMGAANVWQAAADSEPVVFYDGDGGEYHVITSTNSAPVNILLQGELPHGVYEIPFGDAQKIEDWYDVTKLSSLQADILSQTGGSTDACKIFLEQYRSY